MRGEIYYLGVWFDGEQFSICDFVFGAFSMEEIGRICEIKKEF